MLYIAKKKQRTSYEMSNAHPQVEMRRRRSCCLAVGRVRRHHHPRHRNLAALELSCHSGVGLQLADRHIQVGIGERTLEVQNHAFHF